MGVIWTILPLNDRIKPWLEDMGIAYPNSLSRFPTGMEIKSVLRGLKDYKIDIYEKGIGVGWQAVISHKNDINSSTILNIRAYAGDNEQQKISFSKGCEKLNEDILKRLTIMCGPLVLIPDTGEDPAVITP